MRTDRPAPSPGIEPFLAAAPTPWIAWSLALLLLAAGLAALAASAVIRVPETVQAPFVLVPAAGADPVRAPRSATVAAVRVAEGGTVRHGEPIAVLRAASVGAGWAELEGLDRRAADGREREGLVREQQASQADADAAEARRLRGRLVHLADRAALSRAKRPIEEERHRARLRALDEEIAALAREAEFKGKHLRVADDIAGRHQGSYERGFLSWIEYVRPQLDAERVSADLAGLERQRAQARERRAQLEAERQAERLEATLAVDAIEAEARDTADGLARVQAEAAGRRAGHRERARGLREDLDRDGIRLAALRRDLADSRGNEQIVSAPCTGTVLRLGARAAGAVVQEGDLLAEIACEGAPLHAELVLPRDGVGRLRPGLGAKLLYDAFPYQRHGARGGRVSWVSPSVVATGAAGGFRAHVELGDHVIRTDGRHQALMAGMTGRAEIVVGRRTLIGYAFEPLRALRENLSPGPAGEAAAPPAPAPRAARPAEPRG